MESNRTHNLQKLQDFSVNRTVKVLRDQLGISNRNLARNYHKYYPHSIGHWLGMDLHDAPLIGGGVPFQEGMIFTIEPGIYLPNHPEVPEK